MNRPLQILVLVALIFGGLAIYEEYKDRPEPATEKDTLITFNQKTPLRVMVADDVTERTMGLSGVEQLPETHGLLFVFDTLDQHGIWMKDMYFPIDIIWLDETGQIVDIKSNATPDSYPNIFRPTAPARFVIETNAHFADSFNIKPGDHVDLPNSLLPRDLR